MATISRRMLKLIAVAGTVPAVGIALGYRMRVQAAESSTSGGSRVYRTCDLPLYETSGSERKFTSGPPYPQNIVEEQIGVIRRAVQDFLKQFQGTFDTINSTAQTGIAHTKSGIDYIQNEPGELPRIAFIALAGMGGIVLGYRGGVFKKLTYGSIAAVSAASLSYPKKTVELTQVATSYVKEAFEEAGIKEAWEKVFPKDKKEVNGSETTSKPVPKLQSNEKTTSSERKVTKLEGDPGQSNPSDKDMYSTRSS